MAVFLFIFIAILAFLGFADKGRFREMFPICISAVFLRFLDHYLVIDWFKMWAINGGHGWQIIWYPMFANLTIWPIAAYLYIQNLPKQKHVLQTFVYSAFYVAIMTIYIKLLTVIGVIDMNKGWAIWHSIAVISSFFFLIYWIYRWLTQPVKGGVQNG